MDCGEDGRFVPERGFYQPSSEETWESYQALLSVVQYQSNTNLPGVVLCGVADEVLSVLKSNTIKTPGDKKAEIEKILNPLPDFIFDQLLSTAQLITDYYGGGGGGGGGDDRFVCENEFYQPRTDETWAAYKLLLDFVNGEFDYEQPQMVQCVVAHQVLAILKDGLIENSLKREMIQNTLNCNPMSDEKFHVLLFIGQLITDFSAGNPRLMDVEDEAMNQTSDTHPVDVIGSSSATQDEYSRQEEIMRSDFEKVLIAHIEESKKDEYSRQEDDFEKVLFAGKEDEYNRQEEIMRLDFENVLIADKEDEYSTHEEILRLDFENVLIADKEDEYSSQEEIMRLDFENVLIFADKEDEYSRQEEILRLDIENVLIAGKEDEQDWVIEKEDEQDWVMVDFQGDV